VLRKISTLILFCQIGLMGFSESKMDSLKLVMQEQADSTQVITLVKYARSIVYENAYLSEQCAILALRKLKDLDSTKSYNLGNLATAYSILGQLKKNTGDFELALEYQLKTAEIMEGLQNSIGLASVYNDLGIIYKTMKLYESAFKYYLKSHNMCKSIGLDRGTIMTANNLGTILVELEKFDEALSFYNLALVKSDSLEYLNGKAIALNNIGELYSFQGKFNLALEKFEQALIADSMTNDQFGVIYTMLNISTLGIKSSELEKSRHYLATSLKLAKENRSKQILAECYKVYSKYYEKVSNYNKALRYRDTFQLYNDSVYNEIKSNQILEMQTKYETEKKEKDLAEQ